MSPVRAEAGKNIKNVAAGKEIIGKPGGPMEGEDSLRPLLIDLINTPGVCGFEGPIRQKIEDLIRPLVDRLETDALGNLIATQEGQAERRVALFAHMDELGLVVSNITPEGFLRFKTIVCMKDLESAVSLILEIMGQLPFKIFPEMG
jgi:M42 glutamyl aminopeptidase